MSKPLYSCTAPAIDLPSPSPRRTSRRDVDLGLPATSPLESPSPLQGSHQKSGLPATAPAEDASPASAASQPYYASPDEGDDDEHMMSEDNEDDEEISLAGTPEVSQLYFRISWTAHCMHCCTTSSACHIQGSGVRTQLPMPAHTQLPMPGLHTHTHTHTSTAVAEHNMSSCQSNC